MMRPMDLRRAESVANTVANLATDLPLVAPLKVRVSPRA
jgi:hypothetical protein